MLGSFKPGAIEDRIMRVGSVEILGPFTLAGLSQTQTLSQQQVLAPQLQQSLQILQAPMLELRNLIQQEIETNPTLELEQTEPTIEDRQAERDEEWEKEYEKLAKLDEEWRDRSCSAARSASRLRITRMCCSVTGR